MKVLFTSDTALPNGAESFDLIYSCALLKQIKPQASQDEEEYATSRAFKILDESLIDFMNEAFGRISKAYPQSDRLKSCLETLFTSSLILEKSNVHKSPYLEDLLVSAWIAVQIEKLFENGMKGADLHLPSSAIEAGVKKFSQLSFPDYKFNVTDGKRSKKSILNQSFILLYLKSVVWLCVEFAKYPRGRNRANNVEFVTGGILWLDYFFGRVPTGQGFGASKYWGSVPFKMETLGYRANFAHIFVPDKAIKYLSQARKSNLLSSRPSLLIQDLNRPGDFLHVFFSLTLVYLAWVRSRVAKVFSAQSREDWYLRALLGDLAKSLFGTIASSHLLFDASFTRLAKKCSEAQLTGVAFVSEFQGWESILVNRLKSQGISSVGYCHSTVRALDMRGLRVGSSLNRLLQPSRPTFVAVQSLMDLEKLSRKNPDLILVKVESCRYGELLRQKPAQPFIVPKRLLLVGSYSDLESAHMLNVCSEAKQLLKESVSFSFLPHPNSQVNSNEFSHVSRPQGMPFSFLLHDFDAVVAAAETSGAMEALLMGLQVNVVVLPGRLNASPLLGVTSVEMVTNAAQLSTAINSFRPFNESELERLAPFSDADPKLPLWSAAITKLQES